MSSIKTTLARHKQLLVLSIVAIAVVAYVIHIDKVTPALAQPKYGGKTTGTFPGGGGGGGPPGGFPGRGGGVHLTLPLYLSTSAQ